MSDIPLKEVAERLDTIRWTGTVNRNQFMAAEQAASLVRKVDVGEYAEVVHASWVKDRDTIKCTQCGLGIFPSQYIFQDGECTFANSISYRPKYCPGCGSKMDAPMAAENPTK